MTDIPVPAEGGQVPPDAHGAAPTRGIENVPRSTTETGKFGRLQRGLPPLQLDDSQIQAVVSAMIDVPDQPAGGWSGSGTSLDTGLASGWTYFGQFVDHDITFDPVSMLEQANDPDALSNFRTPRFDLDSLYGLGPAVSPWLYDKDDALQLLLGINPPEFAQRDINRNHQGEALIGDPRNDVHVIVSQLHLAFAAFHNHVVDRVRQEPTLLTGVPATPSGGWGSTTPTPGQPTFDQIATLVRWHYQWLVLTEYLPMVVGTETATAVLQHDTAGQLDAKLELYSVRRNPWIPVEFSAAAYRFGHSLVRDSYVLNGGLTPLPVFSPEGEANPLADLRGSRRLPAGWEIEWHRFFDGLPSSGADTQRARLFDTRIAAPLHGLPSTVDTMGRSLAFLNMKRGVAVQLPSGEDFAAAVAGKLGIDAPVFDTGLPHAAPLWFWFLKEAEVINGGQHLGPIAGRVVAEVLVGLAQNDPSSFLKVQPGWTPTLGPQPGAFAMANLLGQTIV